MALHTICYPTRKSSPQETILAPTALAEDAPPRSWGRYILQRLQDLPYWLIILVLGLGSFFYSISASEIYTDAFDFLWAGVWVTVRVTLSAYACSIVIGLLTSLARLSKNPVLRNVATLYVEVMRGLPTLVTILYVAFVLAPQVFELVRYTGDQLAMLGLLAEENFLSNLRRIDSSYTATAALALTYGAFSSEIFRAGIQSIEKGQIEASRSLGMSYFQTMRFIVLPQAVRRVLPPLGNDFIALLKDSSLVTILGVRDITQLARLHASATFQYLPTYNTLAMMYLTITVFLSLGVKALERRMKIDH